MIHPLGKDYTKYRVSQPFFAKNPIYRSGRHMGTDYAVKQVPLYAPCDGRITQVFTDGVGAGASMGNACIFEFTYNNQLYTARFLHLDSVPQVGEYKEGDRIGTTGKTGMGTSWHLHLDVAKGPINWAHYRTEIGISQNLVDPEDFFEVQEETEKIDVFKLLDKYDRTTLVTEIESRKGVHHYPIKNPRYKILIIDNESI